MAETRLNANPGYAVAVGRPRPSDEGTLFGHSQGGIAPQPHVLNRPELQNFTESNFGGAQDSNDTLIQRTRMYVYRNPNAIPAGLAAGNFDQTKSGPAKSLPTTRFNRNIRPIVGGGHRNMWGQHTNLNTGKAANQLKGRSRMKTGKQNNLTVQRYRGQSYSATTKLAGQ